MESIKTKKRKTVRKAEIEAPRTYKLKVVPVSGVPFAAYSEIKLEKIVEAATAGVEAKYLLELSSMSGLGNNFIESAMDLSSKSIKRYVATNKKLNPTQSEKYLRLMKVFAKGIDIFGDQKNFSEWLLAPSFGLGLKTPISFTTTIGGMEMIMDELDRIEQGAIA